MGGIVPYSLMFSYHHFSGRRFVERIYDRPRSRWCTVLVFMQILTKCKVGRWWRVKSGKAVNSTEHCRGQVCHSTT